MDLKSEEQSRNLFKALKWIGQKNEPRDLTSLTPHATTLTVSLTISTIHSLGEVPEDEEMEELSDYAHLAPLLAGRGEYMEMDA
jgi:aromatic ring-opening dioxygenase LigB subunit